MCGREGKVYRADVEGTELNICHHCSKFGKIKKEVKPPPSKKEVERRRKFEEEREKAREAEERKEIIQMVVDNYAALIKKARERKGLKQEEVANKINEKLSLIHQLETGHIGPSIKVAEKLEHFFGIKLIIEIEEEHGKIGKAASDEITIGDMIKIKTRKKL